LVLEGLVEREHDYALIISLDSVNSSTFVEAYTPIHSPDLSTLSHVYLSACDFPETESSTFCNTTHTPANSTTSASKRLAAYTDLFLSTKKKYKPIAKKVHPVTEELPEKFRIEHKIIGNPLDKISLTRTILAASCGQRRGTLCITFMLAHDSGFTWSEGE
jgi:hypothetical protein